MDLHANSLTKESSPTTLALSLYYHTLSILSCLRLYSEAPPLQQPLCTAQCFENTEDETELETSEAVVVGSKILPQKMAFSAIGLLLSGYLLTPVRPPLNLHQTC